VEDLVGDILGDSTAHDAVLNAFERVGTPDFIRGIVFNEPRLSLRVALRMVPNYEFTLKTISDALASL
jgi:hypothetical protein